jgi:hypothetical protein
MINSYELIEEWYEKLGKVPIYKKGKLPDVDTLLKEIDYDVEIELEEINFDDQLKKFYEKGLMIINKNEIKNAFVDDLRKDIKLLKEINLINKLHDKYNQYRAESNTGFVLENCLILQGKKMWDSKSINYKANVSLKKYMDKLFTGSYVNIEGFKAKAIKELSEINLFLK